MNPGAEDTEGGKGIGSAVAQLGAGLVAAAHGEPFASVPMVMRGVRGAADYLRQPNPRIREGIAGVLFNPNVTENQTVLQGLGGMSPPRPWLPMITPVSRKKPAVCHPASWGGGVLPNDAPAAPAPAPKRRPVGQ